MQGGKQIHGLWVCLSTRYTHSCHTSVYSSKLWFGVRRKYYLIYTGAEVVIKINEEVVRAWEDKDPNLHAVSNIAITTTDISVLFHLQLTWREQDVFFLRELQRASKQHLNDTEDTGKASAYLTVTIKNWHACKHVFEMKTSVLLRYYHSFLPFGVFFIFISFLDYYENGPSTSRSHRKPGANSLCWTWTW